METWTWIRHTAAVFLLAGFGASPAIAGIPADELIQTAHYADGKPVPYVLTSEPAPPAYVVILMPGGVGIMAPEIRNGKLVFRGGGNFLIRSRALFADESFAAVSTDATGSAERMTAILEDLERRFPQAKVYIIGTSRSTYGTMKLAEALDGKVAGFIHTSSMNTIAVFDPRKLKSRNLIVHHKADSCRQTGYGSAESSHERYGTELITMQGGITDGDPCEAYAHHGYNGIEKETVEQIKAWIRR